MLTHVAILAGLLTGAQQPSPPIGQRTVSPEQLLSSFGLTPSAAEDDPAVAAAQSHPLGSERNPVRVGGPEGERAYLARLRCADGSRPNVGSRTDGGVGAFGSIVGAYRVECGAAAPGSASVLLDIYHEEHREERAPPGFTLAPAP